MFFINSAKSTLLLVSFFLLTIFFDPLPGYSNFVFLRTTTELQASLEKSEAAHAKTQHALKTSTSQISTLTTQAHESSQLIKTLRQQILTLQQEVSTMETKFQREMTTTKELTEMLAQLRTSMKHDSELDLKKLNQLESELKNRAGTVEETATSTRTRMDSGAFLEHTHSTTTAS